MQERVIWPSAHLVLCFIMIGSDVLYSVRRKTPWIDCWSGLGGNVESYDYDLVYAVIREAWQEASLIVFRDRIRKVAEFKVFREGKGMTLLHVFLTDYYEGIPRTTSEMGPHRNFSKRIFPKKTIPGDNLWLPEIFDGEIMGGSIHRSADLETLRGINIYPVDPKSFIIEDQKLWK